MARVTSQGTGSQKIIMASYKRCIPVSLFAPAMIAACASSEHDAAGAPEGQSPAETPIVVQREVDQNTRIGLTRGWCYGTCPVYSLEISGDGSVAYVGEEYVKVVGAASGEIPVDAVQQLVDEMLAANYFQLSTVACPTAVDTPPTTTSLTLGAQTHTLASFNASCQLATQLAQRIDEVTGSAQWIRCDTPSGSCDR